MKCPYLYIEKVTDQLDLISKLYDLGYVYCGNNDKEAGFHNWMNGVGHTGKSNYPCMTVRPSGAITAYKNHKDAKRDDLCAVNSASHFIAFAKNRISKKP